MKKRTVALLLARGALGSPSQLFADLKYKALLPIDGIPMVEHVLTALQDSAAEKIFIVQGADEFLERKVQYHVKHEFIFCGLKGSSYAHSLFSGLCRLADYYGPMQLSGLEIMLVPCDVPMVTGRTFDRLIAANEEKDCDVCIPLIRAELLRERYCWRDFQRFYFADLGADYCVQNFAFIKGSTLADYLYRRCGAGERPRLSANLMADLAARADHLVSLRKIACLVQVAVLGEMLWRLAEKKHLVQALLMLGKLLRRRCTTLDFKRLIIFATGISSDYINSQETEISFDIDRLEHIEGIRVLKPGELIVTAAG
jgi:molybdopterin-guanine dinucleotide biosynthesis protein A